jgi:hypothetical protein
VRQKKQTERSFKVREECCGVCTISSGKKIGVLFLGIETLICLLTFVSNEAEAQVKRPALQLSGLSWVVSKAVFAK